jgi:nicotinate phosphoribosyltransferase
LIFDGVSNVLSGCLFNLPAKGTLAHAYVMSYQGMDLSLAQNDPIYSTCLKLREKYGFNTNLQELFSFVSFASVYKNSSVLLVDTYDTIESGVKNAILVSLALKEVKNYSIRGIRLDSGDLAELSKRARTLFLKYSELTGVKELENIMISASNDINENSLRSFNSKGHEMNLYGIGTNLVTCQLQPFMNVIAIVEKSEISGSNILLKNNQSFHDDDLNKSKSHLQSYIKELKLK